MPRFKIIFLLFLIVAVKLQAQYKNYNLNSYTNPDYQRKSLDIKFNSSGQFYSNPTTSNNNFNGTLGFSFNKTKLSRKVQETLNVGITTNISQIRFDSIDNQKSREYNVGLLFDQKAHYYIDSERFIEISPRINASYRFSKNKKASTEYYNQKNNLFKTELEIDFGIGKGRIENVTDARQAVYILQALHDKKLLKKVLDSGEINELAHQISIIKNKRHFDAREKTIDELTFINNYLISQHYIDTVNTADYFFTLNDFWQNGDLEPRNAGHRFKFGLAPTYIFMQNNTSYQENYHTRSNDVDTKWGGTLYLDYTNEKPLNLKWQRTYNVGMRDGLYRWRTVGVNQFVTYLYGEFGMGCFVDTRTYIKGQINQNFFWNHTPLGDKTERENTLTSNTAIAIKGYYFISAQLKIFGEYGLSYNLMRFTEKNKNINDKYPGSNFHVGLAYSIF